MNKELELEAENYGWRVKINSFSDPIKANELAKSASDDFIAGATSKYVEKQKLEFTIEQLKSLGQIHSETAMSQRTKFKIKQLEEQLKSLENGTTNT